MTKPILYGVDLSTFVRTARIAFAEKGVDCELQPRELDAADYDKLHPFRRMPAMHHGDVHLFETLAIVTYADRAFDGPALVPADAVGAARCMQWVSVHNDVLANEVGRSILFERLGKPHFGMEPDEARIAAALPGAGHALGVLDDALSSSPYLAGKEPSIADHFVLPVAFYATLAPDTQAMVAGRKHLSACIERMNARPSVQATMPNFG